MRGKEHLYDLAAPAAFLALAALLAPWAGDFPLNDDWAYALPVKRLAETGRLALSDWGSSTQLAHILPAALAAKLFGFGFGLLRCLTLLWSAAALFVFSKLLGELEVPAPERALAGLALALNPLFLVLSASFMTDCPYLFWMLAALYFYLRDQRAPGGPWLWAAGACAAAAFLTRQLGVVLPAAAVLSLYLQKRLDRRSFAAACALPAAAALGYWAWFKFGHGPTWASENYVGAATLGHLARPAAFLKDTAWRLLAGGLTAGLLLLPLGAGLAAGARRLLGKNELKARLTAAGPWLALALLGGFALLSGPLPYLENTLSRAGLGVLTLGGGAQKPSGFFASPLFWQAATAAAAVSAALLLGASSLALRAGGPGPRLLFLAAAGHLALSLAGAKFFDRYLLTLLPWFAAAAAYCARGVKFSRPAAALALALFALAGWAGMADYLAWNRAKWELASRPRPGLEPAGIAAGFDYEAWLTYEPNMAYLKSMKPLRMIGEWEWQGRNNYRALISFAPDPRFAVADRASYSTPLAPGKAEIFLLAAK